MHAGNTQKGIIREKETSVAVDQCKSEWQVGEQLFDMHMARAILCCAAIVIQCQQDGGTIRSISRQRNMKQPYRRSMATFAGEIDRSFFVHSQQCGAVTVGNVRGFAARCPQGECRI